MARSSKPKGLVLSPEAGADRIWDESLHEHISRAAYFRAAARGFMPGGELDDWLEAEREIRRTDTFQASQNA